MTYYPWSLEYTTNPTNNSVQGISQIMGCDTMKFHKDTFM